MRQILQLLAAASPSNPVKVFFLRLSGARIGHHVKLRRGSYIFAPQITIGNGTILEPHVHIVCGQFHAGTECKIDSETVIYGEGSLFMDEGSYIGPRSWINPATTIRIGKRTGVGAGGMIFTHGMWLPYLDGYPGKAEDVVLGNQVWVQANVTILPGVEISDGAMVGAGAVVTKDVPAGTFVAGVPAKAVSSVSELMAPRTPEDLEARALEILESFTEFAARAGWSLERGRPPLQYAFGSRRGARTWVAFYPRLVTSTMLAELMQHRGKAPHIIILALRGFDQSAGDLLRTDSIDWFDLSATEAKASWHAHTMAFRRFLGSHWGMRFTLIERT